LRCAAPKASTCKAVIAASPVLKEVLDAVGGGVFSPDEPGRFKALVDAVTFHDYFMVSADFDAYFAAQRQLDDLWQQPSAWWSKAVLEHRADGLVLVRPHHRGICQRDLEREPSWQNLMSGI
jgi:glucan phosphorylase